MANYEMFTKEEALKFLESRLGVKDVQKRRISNPQTLLDDITTSIQAHIPFNNMSLMSIAPEKRRRPTLEEIKESVVSGTGGLCYVLNVALFCILKALGFDVVMASVNVFFPRNHILVYARDVNKEGDVFLIDSGFGYPTFRAISLDFEKESPEFTDSFIEYKYMKKDKKILRLHRNGDFGQRSAARPVYIDGWRVAYVARCYGTANIEDFYLDYDEVYTFQSPIRKPFKTSFQTNFRLVQFPEKRAVIISNLKLMLENESGNLETILMEGGDEGILSAVRRYFPVIPEEMARQAVSQWRKLYLSKPE
ncbi:arylamine n-acetyltransferase 1-like [Plakobranchus ocellatus]|uniref:arylamine N-acetyltransferase n=1 Tax=Plakobranchus ocellatus TaxID=259542 RepID=A0AAV3Z6A9_9GAST|nr:arylamine n-acetyltransferase 1-like [Plakobranchus ocellatus]